jgi:VWFA-related protein
MRIARRFALPVFCLAVLGGLLPRLAARTQAPAKQRPSEQDDPQYRIRVRTELVVVPVSVKDPNGTLVTNIVQDEFRIFEDGVEQSVDVYSQDSFPLSAVVVLDNNLDVRAAESLQKTAPTLAGGFGEFDEVALVMFDEQPRTVLPFTSDNDKLFDHLKRMSVDATLPGAGSGPMTAGPIINQTSPEAKVTVRTPTRGQRVKHLDDAVHAAAELLRDRGRDRRKILLLISDGQNSPNNTVSRDEAIKLLLSYDISVYAIGVGITPGNRLLNPLGRYASATGGDVFYGTSRAELETLYARATEQARNQYTLAYAPRGTDRKKEYHQIEVRVKRPNLSILARDGYYSVPVP